MSSFLARLAAPLLMCGLAVAVLGTQSASASPTTSSRVTNAGYIAGTPSADSQVTGAFTVPKLSCPSHGFSAIQPQILLSGFETDSTVFAGVQLLLQCEGGVASYSPFILANGSGAPMPVPITVRPGDTLRVKITDASTGALSVTVSDGTQTVTRSGFGFPASELIANANVECGPPRCPPFAAFPKFGTIAFSGVTVSGMTLQQLGATRLDGHNGGTGFIRTSALVASGAGFHLTWEHS